METKIQKWGNSQGLRLAKQILYEARLVVGDSVTVSTKEGQIVIAPVRRVQGPLKLKELVSRIPKTYNPEETEWGKPIGKEAW